MTAPGTTLTRPAPVGTTDRRPRRGVRLAKRTALTIDRAVPAHPGLVVLAYHRVGARTSSAVDLPLDAFERQIAHLAASGTVRSLDDGLAELERNAEGWSGVVGVALVGDGHRCSACVG